MSFQHQKEKNSAPSRNNFLFTGATHCQKRARQTEIVPPQGRDFLNVPNTACKGIFLVVCYSASVLGQGADSYCPAAETPQANTPALLPTPGTSCPAVTQAPALQLDHNYFLACAPIIFFFFKYSK